MKAYVGVANTPHAMRFYEHRKKLRTRGDPVEVYQSNTTGRIIAKYEWTEKRF